MTTMRQADLNTFGLRVWGDTVDRLYPPHRHNEIEINALEDGFFTYVLAGREVTVAAGEICVFWGAIPHQVIRLGPQTRVYWATIPLNEALRWDLPSTFVRALLSGRLFIDDEPLYDARFFTAWSAELAAGRPSIVLAELRALCLRMAQRDLRGPIAREVSSSRAQQMAQFMSAHFSEPLRVDGIARQVGLHPNYAMTVFRDAFGMSLIEYLTQQRIAHAMQQLILTDAPVASIALDSGFATLSHFYAAFRRACGMAPGQYRAAVRGRG
jgi:AraC-like DNA-binding protein